MPLCETNPALPMIGIVLSALAVLATLKLLLRLMTLETRAAILDELAEIDESRSIFIDDDRTVRQTTDGEIRHDETSGGRSDSWRRHCRLLLLVPSFALVLGCATVLYLTTIDDCDFPDRDASTSSTPQPASALAGLNFASHPID